MRTIGNIERFLVLGIVVVIGAILTVAITGARDLERNAAQSETAAKPATGAGATPLKNGSAAAKSGGSKPNREAAKERQKAPRGEPGAPLRPGTDPGVQALIDRHRDAIEGRKAEPAPAHEPPLEGVAAPAGGDAPPQDFANPAGMQAEKPAVFEAPDVVDEAVTPPATAAPLARIDPDDVVPPPQPGSRVPSAEATQHYVYEVQKGDSLERIARTLYGDGKTWKEILAANPDLTDAHTIRAGDRLKLPRAPTQASDAVAIGPHDTAAKPATPAEATPIQRVSRDEQYRVQKGDTLMSIAAANYGTKSAWRVIYEANADLIPDKDRIKTGIVLKLPPR